MGVGVRTESKKMAVMAFSNYKRRVSCAGNFAQKQEMENKQFSADENKTVNRKWSCDEDGVHMSTKWLPIPRFLRKNEKFFLKRKISKNKARRTGIFQGSHFLPLWLGL